MYTPREVEDRDIQPLAEFLCKGFPGKTTEFWLSLFKLWWTTNPAFTDHFPRGWVIEQDALIVGFLANIPVNFQIGGEVKIAAAANSWYVDPSVRSTSSLRLFDEFIEQKGASLFLFKPECESPFLKTVMRILPKYKFEKIILPPSQKEFVYIMNKKKVYFIFKNFILKNKMPTVSQLPRYYRRFGELLYAFVYQKPLNRRNFSRGEPYISSLCTSCDDSFSRIWKPFLNTSDVFLSRDIKTLNWLYFSPGRLYKRVVIQCHRSCDKTLAGYMVFDIQRSTPSDDGRMRLIDMCVENNDPQVLASLTSFAIKTGKQYNAALMVLWADNPETEEYFNRAIALKRTAHQYRHFRFPGSPIDLKSGMRDHGTVRLPMIFPPQ